MNDKFANHTPQILDDNCVIAYVYTTILFTSPTALECVVWDMYDEADVVF